MKKKQQQLERIKGELFQELSGQWGVLVRGGMEAAGGTSDTLKAEFSGSPPAPDSVPDGNIDAT